MLSFLEATSIPHQSTLHPKGLIAEEQLKLFIRTVWVSVFIFIPVFSVLLWACVRYRERKSDIGKPFAQDKHVNPLIEVGLILIPFILLIFIAIPTVQNIYFADKLPKGTAYYEASKLQNWYPGKVDPKAAQEVLIINARGYQWWFEFEYPQLGIKTANEFYIPAGKVVQINLYADDVIHSFWLPKLAGKVDMIPGQLNHMWIFAGDPFERWIKYQPASLQEGSQKTQLQAYEHYLKEQITGYYYGQCAEFCGEAHAYMLFRTEVVTNQDFADWVNNYKAGAKAPGGFKKSSSSTYKQDWDAWQIAATQNALPDEGVHRGAQLFLNKGQCIVCHTISNSHAAGVIGPNLTKVAQRKSLAAGILNFQNPDNSINRQKQLEALYLWIKDSYKIKPGNIMYYDKDAGLINLKTKGLTYQGLTKFNITDRFFLSNGVSRSQLATLKANPDSQLSSVIKNQPILRRLVNQMEIKHPNAFAQISGWLTDEEFKDIASFLQTLQ